MNEGNQFGMVIHITADRGAELGIFFTEARFKDGHCAQRQKTHHGADLKAVRLSIWESEHVVKEPVLFIPHAELFFGPDHPGGDQEEMLIEFRHELEVDRVGHRQLCGDLDHVLRKKRHPGRAVGLFQISAGG